MLLQGCLLFESSWIGKFSLESAHKSWCIFQRTRSLAWAGNTNLGVSLWTDWGNVKDARPEQSQGLAPWIQRAANPGSVSIWLLAKWSWEATSRSPEGKVYVLVEPSGGQKWLNRGIPAKQGRSRRGARNATGSRAGRAGLLKLPRFHLKPQVADVELEDLLPALVCFHLGVPDQSLFSPHSPFCNMATSLCQFALKVCTSIFYRSSQLCVASGLQWRLDLVILNSIRTL